MRPASSVVLVSHALRQWMRTKNVPLLFTVCCFTTTALSAFMVFQIQPLIGKAILPWFGGGPSVWTTCLLFFQLLLLGGYAYAHLINRVLPTHWQAVVHAVLVCGTVLVLPIIPDSSWEPADAHHPAWRILVLLTAHVGLPYFLLSASAPLLQAWYGTVHRDRVPYRLYALSNVGSLTALLSFPLVIEPMLDTSTQSTVWSMGFYFYALICIGLAVILSVKKESASQNEDSGEVAAADDAASECTGLKSWCRWMLLSALGSAALMAITNQMCQEISVVPLLWVVPLSIYLLSFIICFDRPGWFLPRWWALAGMVGILALASYRQDTASVLDDVLESLGFVAFWESCVGDIKIEAALLSLGLFLICMMSHGQLVRSKPGTNRLTSFYLAVASGGAVGGIFVALVCPFLFTTFFETELVLAAGFLLAVRMFVDEVFGRWGVSPIWIRLGTCVTVTTGLVLILAGSLFGVNDDTLVRVRNFYGVVHVDLTSDGNNSRLGRRLTHGRTQHGFQYIAKNLKQQPTTYYDRPSGVGVALEAQASQGPMRVGVVGLGAGTLAAYGREGDFYHFYEINPVLVELAEDQFRFLRDSPATIQTTLGDARISLKRQPTQNFDVLVLDAFSGDAIPLHLLTLEAFEIYLKHVSDEGVIAVHITNRYFDLLPVVAGVARRFELSMILIDADSGEEVDADSIADASSRWVLLTRNNQLVHHPLVLERAKPTNAHCGPPIVWTDQYSNLLQVMW